MSGLTSIGYFLISTLFSLITFVLWARLFIRYFSISRFSPFYQSIYQLTNPVIVPIQQHLFHNTGTRGPYDWAALAFLIFCELLKFAFLNFFFLHNALPLLGIALFTFVNLIIQPCNILFYAILIRVVMSWFNPDWHNPFASVLIAVTEPPLRMIRNVLPNFGMIDFSPIVAIVALKVIELFALGLLPFPMI
ncbi:MAG: hypothetical protein A3F46_03455 [Legionellales bacterium RIFCSPHIGHO2_12_FULL_42_9]|nr:MAG: hypothetical protein A3F46_03455 [Legionellales bacterium RIFCSPHIGHO2_12_FULL_42_9]